MPFFLLFSIPNFSSIPEINFIWWNVVGIIGPNISIFSGGQNFWYFFLHFRKVSESNSESDKMSDHDQETTAPRPAP